MPYQMLKAEKPIKVFVDDLNQVESVALDQLRNTAKLPWVEAVAAMPDVHFGLGATVGSVIVAREALSPSAVGVDIGCGVCAVKTPYNANDFKNTEKTLRELRHSIERSIPAGFNSNTKIAARVEKAFQNIGEMSGEGKKREQNLDHWVVEPFYRTMS